MSLRCLYVTFCQRYPAGTAGIPRWPSFFLRALPLFALQNAIVQLCGSIGFSAQLHQACF